ncbi:hypothetical protein HID58_076755 [Brassica napus]|uniref:Serine aminopeptidase S33 domain-containing protein n=1 Tax=Brassica napus TaxID=3708 RepID=A0ABQ7YND3_BRANA|nr:hypothetical protein HID58_076755 [Brassica napus]
MSSPRTILALSMGRKNRKALPRKLKDLWRFSPMAATVLGSVFGISPVSTERVCNADFRSTKSNLRGRTQAIKSVAPTNHGGVRRVHKNKEDDGEGAKVAKLVESPYSKVEAARPDLRKRLSEFLEEARDLVGDDDGPPRWFSPLECSSQAPGSPLLLFIPGIDGTGLGLIRHHKKLGEIFDVWCLHIPVRDRTPAKDLVKLIERTVKSENYRFPNRPIYLVGESIGACLALDVASRNPNIDLALILANPATDVNNFMSQPLSGMLNVLPDGVPTLLEEIFGFKQGGPLTAMLDALTNEFYVHQMGGVGGGILRDIFAVSANLPTLSRMFPKDTLLWKLELLKSAVASANSHIHAVRAETLILLSGRDQWLLNVEDIDRLALTLPKCIVRKMKDSGQFLYFEDGVDLVTIIKCTCFYRRGKSHDHLSDYIMPTTFELKQQIDDHKLLIDATSPVMLSTLANGKVLLKERNIHLRGLAHPMLFVNNQDALVDTQMFDKYKIMGGVPVSNFNIYKLLSLKSHVLLYPGGVREALHRKGEEYKLFWPEQPEFVRVASKFGAKIVPFGVVGEDDIFDIVLDGNDQKNIPILKDLMAEATKQAGNLREGDESELGNQDCYFPGLLPKIPGRFYYYFGKPIETAGREQELKDKEKAQEFYLQVKSEVEECIAYLKMKRESDPYRNLLPRVLYQASHVVLGSINGLSSVSSLSRETFRNAGFFCWKQSSSSKYRLTAIRLESSTTTHGGIRRIRKNQDEKVAKVVESPYANVEEERPDSRKSLLDFLEEVRDFVGEEGPPRWFSPLESSVQAQGSPLLLFIPGIDGTGLGLIRQHKKLGELFDIWCLHIPARDRTSSKDLVKLIEQTVKSENHHFPNRPIYLVGESIGACLALDVAARNPNIDLVLILANPATHIHNLMSQPLSGMLNVLPDGIPTLLEEIFGFKQGGPLTETLEAFSNEFSVHQIGGMMLRDLFAVSANLPTLSRIFSKDTLLWKLEMFKSAIASAKSNISAVRAESLILLSGRDQWMLNLEDIDRFSRRLPNCILRKFNDSGPFLLLEDDVDLVTIIKCTCFYRRGRSHDYISDYIMPTPYELRKQLEEHRLLIYATSPVMLSTLENGKIVRSLEGLPSEGPVLYVGYHMILGFELPPMIAQLMKERNIQLRGLTHPIIFMNKTIVHDILDPQIFDKYKITGGAPVSHANIYKLLSSKSHVLLYPGGVREALHRKGEEYKLFWPEQPEFVRVASKFGAKIVPFGVVGEDDICKIVLDSNDQRNIPILKELMEMATKEAGNLRKGHESELGNQDFYLPGLVPKIPGRFYYYFGKPIETSGKEQELRDKEKAQELYLQVKSQVEQCIAYLKMKRESDPYRNLLPRMLYQASRGFSSEIPTFDL